MNSNHIDNHDLAVSEQIAKVLHGGCSENNICLVTDILATLVDKWTIHTILLLGQHPKLRFNQIKSGIRGISQRMLTVTLRSLEQNGVLLRTQYSETPPRVEYELTSLGKGFLARLIELAGWADENFKEIVKSRSRYQKAR